MTHVELTDNILTVHVQGIDRLLSLRRRFAIPLDHVVSVETGDGAAATGGIGALASHVPAAIAPKTFHQQSGRRLLEGHAPGHTLTIRLWNERYDRLVLDVENPRIVANAIVRAVRATPDTGGAGGIRNLKWNPSASAFGSV